MTTFWELFDAIYINIMYTSTKYLHIKVLPIICLSWKKCHCCLSLTIAQLTDTECYCQLFFGKPLKKYFQVKFRWQTSDPLITVNCFDLPLILFLFYFVPTTDMAINSSNYIIVEQLSQRWNSAFNTIHFPCTCIQNSYSLSNKLQCHISVKYFCQCHILKMK